MASVGIIKTLPEVFTSYQKAIETELRGIVDNKPLPLYSMLRYHLGWEDEQGHPSHGPPPFNETVDIRADHVDNAQMLTTTPILGKSLGLGRAL